MNGDQKIFVLDTNILIDYPDLIPKVGGEMKEIENPTVDLTGAHIVIPSAVVREMSKFKDEHSGRESAARTVLRNLRDLFEAEGIYGMNTNYTLGASISLEGGGRLSVLPVSADFKESLPFRPSEDDIDGQVILAALAVMHLIKHDSIPGRFVSKETINWKDSSTRLGITNSNVVLLTNDNGLAIRAMKRGVVTSRFHYDLPEPYTGRRAVTVPPEVFLEFWYERKLEREFWEEFVPKEAPLVANEFIVMEPDIDESITQEVPLEYLAGEDPYFRHIGRYDVKEDAIVGLQHVSDAPFKILSDGQAMYAEAILSPEIAAVICTGPAGSGKTYLPTVYGFNACRQGAYNGIVVVPCIDDGRIGALPGGIDDKMVLDVGPFRNALENYLYENNNHFAKELSRLSLHGAGFEYQSDAEKVEPSLDDKIQAYITQIWRRFFKNIPVQKAQGLDFWRKLVFYDEFQDQPQDRADMLIKRIGKGGKIIITGDIRQIHAPHMTEYNNGIVYATELLFDIPIVARVSLLKDEVERHELVRIIAERQASKQK